MTGRATLLFDVLDEVTVTDEWASGDLEPSPTGEGYRVARTRLRLATDGAYVELQGTRSEQQALVRKLAVVVGLDVPLDQP